jgi:cell division transport system permease protein
MSVWLAQHAQALRAAFGKLGANPLGSLFNVLVMGIALSLPASLYTGLASLSRWSGQHQDHVRLSILLDQDAGEKAFSETAAKLKAHRNVQTIEPLPKERALKAMEEKLGLDNVARALGQNPLPDAFVVHAETHDFAALSAMRDEISEWPNVSEVIWDSEWVKKLQGILSFAETAVWILAALLGFGLLAVTFNTVRLQVLTQKVEIEVASLIGATRAFIRRPFLYFGALQGLFAGLACLGIVALIAWLLQAKIQALNALYGSAFALALPGPWQTLALLALACALGWLGALISVNRHLARASPSP